MRLEGSVDDNVLDTSTSMTLGEDFTKEKDFGRITTEFMPTRERVPRWSEGSISWLPDLLGSLKPIRTGSCLSPPECTK